MPSAENTERSEYKSIRNTEHFNAWLQTRTPTQQQGLRTTMTIVCLTDTRQQIDSPGSESKQHPAEVIWAQAFTRPAWGASGRFVSPKIAPGER